jgi:UDP-glucose:tetrahydrobiopterin glucosyltransferase
VRLAIVAPLVSAIREPQVGGSQAFLAGLARGLVSRGHDVHLYAASGSDVPGVEVIDTGVDHRTLEATLYRAGQEAGGGSSEAAADAFARVYRAVRESGYDVVHNHAFDAPAVTLATGLGAAVVHTLHLPPDVDVAAALRGVAGHEPAVSVACVSEHQARAWRRVVPIDAVLSPLVPTSLIPFSASAGMGALFAGRLSPEKGAAEAIEIALRAGVPIDVYGDPYDPDYTAERVEPWRADPSVSLHPGVAQATLWSAMGRAAAVICPPAWEEPFGMAAAEAQACGTPVVAFRRGALEEVVVDGVTGFVVAPGDIGAAAAALREAPALARSACRAHAERRLDLELSLDAHERLYEWVARPGVRTAIGG